MVSGNSVLHITCTGYDFTNSIYLVRLSFITAEDQQKFDQLFRSAVPPNEQALSGKYLFLFRLKKKP